MIWQYVIPTVTIGDRSRALEVPMDGDTFAGFYQRSFRALWAYLARASGDPSLADDLAQESYVRFLCASTPDGEVASRRYLFRIASNLLRDYWRRPQTTSIDDIPEEFFASQADEGQANSQEALGSALAHMRPRERQLLWLAHAEEYSHREIAEITGLSSASIRILLFRARGKLARLLRASSPRDRRKP